MVGLLARGPPRARRSRRPSRSSSACVGGEEVLPGRDRRAGPACRRPRAPSFPAPPRARSASPSGRAGRPREPAGTSCSSPSRTNVARPATTTYISSCPSRSSVCSSTTSWPGLGRRVGVDAEGGDAEVLAQRRPAQRPGPGSDSTPVRLAISYPLNSSSSAPRARRGRSRARRRPAPPGSRRPPSPRAARSRAGRGARRSRRGARRRRAATRSRGVLPNSCSWRPWSRRSSSIGARGRRRAGRATTSESPA